MENSITILFFDTTWNQLMRFGNSISAIIKSKNKNIKTIAVVCQEKRGIIDSHSFDDIFLSKSNRRVAEYVSSIKPDIAVLVQNTVADQNVILRAKKSGAIVFVLQHGMLYEGASLNNFNLQEVFAAMLNMKKTIKYILTMQQMCKYDNKSFYELIKKIIIEKKDVVRILQNHFSVKLNGDYAMVIGEQWMNYYRVHYDYDCDHVLLMGNHDVDNMILDKTLEEAICYIPSVHVEDGKVRLSVFTKFLSALAKSIDKKTKLYIKMHPRGDINLYKRVFKNHNVFYVTGPELPYVTTYIGHNSTLIAKALMLTKKVILWEFKEEKDLFYKPWAYACCNNSDSLLHALNKANNDSVDYSDAVEDVRKISYINPEGAFNYAGRRIIELFFENRNQEV